jgi:hypothetical protein
MPTRSALERARRGIGLHGTLYDTSCGWSEPVPKTTGKCRFVMTQTTSALHQANHHPFACGALKLLSNSAQKHSCFAHYHLVLHPRCTLQSVWRVAPGERTAQVVALYNRPKRSRKDMNASSTTTWKTSLTSLAEVFPFKSGSSDRVSDRIHVFVYSYD